MNPNRQCLDAGLKWVAIAAAVFCLFWVVRPVVMIVFASGSSLAIDTLAAAVTMSLINLAIGIILLTVALVARAIVRRKAARPA